MRTCTHVARHQRDRAGEGEVLLAPCYVIRKDDHLAVRVGFEPVVNASLVVFDAQLTIDRAACGLLT